MLQVTKLLRLVENQRHGQVIEEVLRNGRPLPVAVRARLEDGASVRLAALGLGLQRVVELSYVPTAEAERLATVAVDAWDEWRGPRAGDSASLSGAPRGELPRGPSPAAISILVAGLVDVLSLAESTGCDLTPGLSGRIRATIRAACYELAATQEGDAVREPRQSGLVGDAVNSVVVLWQLAPREHALDGLAAPSLHKLEGAADRLELWRDPVCGPVLALAHAAPVHGTPPARRIAA